MSASYGRTNTKTAITRDDLLEFVGYFQNSEPAIFSHFSDGENPTLNFPLKSEDAAKFLLLYSSLNQDISEKNLTALPH